jgi:hypothetical protein
VEASSWAAAPAFMVTASRTSRQLLFLESFPFLVLCIWLSVHHTSYSYFFLELQKKKPLKKYLDTQIVQ